MQGVPGCSRVPGKTAEFTPSPEDAVRAPARTATERGPHAGTRGGESDYPGELPYSSICSFDGNGLSGVRRGVGMAHYSDPDSRGSTRTARCGDHLEPHPVAPGRLFARCFFLRSAYSEALVCRKNRVFAAGQG